MITVNLTDKCNQYCIYCEIGQGNVKNTGSRLDYDDLIWIIDQAEEEGIKRISLCGGEPFLFNGLIDLISYAGDKGIQCTITSNGMDIHKLTGKDLDRFNKHNTLINSSVDSFREEIQKYTRGHKYALSNALLSIAKLQQAGIHPTILCVISRHNYNHLYSFVQQAYELQIKQLLFQPVIGESNYPGAQAIDNKLGINIPPDQVDVLYRELKKIRAFEQRHAINTNIYRILPWIGSYIHEASDSTGNWFWEDVLDKFYCRDIYAIIDITFDGGIQACGLAQSTVNIKDRNEESLFTLWHKASRPLKEKLEGGEFETFCNACCHHFSRNMLASIVRYPIRNRRMLLYMSRALIARTLKRVVIH